MIPLNFVPIDCAPPNTVLSACWTSGDGKVEYGSAIFIGSDPLTDQWFQKHLRNAPPPCARPDGVLDDSSPGEDDGLHVDSESETPFIAGKRSMLMKLALKTALRQVIPSGDSVCVGRRIYSRIDLQCALEEARKIVAAFRERRETSELPVGKKCDACEALATRVMNSNTSEHCAWYFIGLYCDSCFDTVTAEMEAYNNSHER